MLTVGGYWIGRYGETTGRDRTHAPFVSVAVVTVLYAVGVLVLHFLLGDPVSARRILVEALVPTIALNLILTAPVYWLVTKLLPPRRLARARGGGAPPWLAPRAAAGRSCRRRPASRSRTASRRRWRCASPCSAASCCSSSPRCSSACGRCRSSPARTTCASRAATSCGRSGSRRRAGRSSTATAACSSRTAAAPPSRSGRPTCRTSGTCALRELKRLSKVVARAGARRCSTGIAARKGDPLTPVIVKEPVGERQIVYLKEHQYEFPRARRSQDSFLRHYPHGRLAAQLFGYVSEVSKQELKKHPFGVVAGDKVGQAGVEAAFDDYLRGTPGFDRLRVNSLGIPQGSVDARAAAAVRATPSG